VRHPVRHMNVTKSSYAHGVSSTPLLGETIGGCLDDVARTQPQSDAVVSRHQGVRLNYHELHAAATRLARSLLASGVQRHDRVGIWSSACSEWMVVQYSAAKIGAVLVTINPAYRQAELERALAQVGVSLLIVGQRSATSPPASGITRQIRLPDLRNVVCMGAGGDPDTVEWTEFAARAERVSDADLSAREAEVSCDDPALILFTSGTTGQPKGVVLSHHSIVNGGFFVGRHLGLTSHDRICQPLPLYHVLGCVAANVAALTHGSTIVLPSDTFDARRCLDAIQEERCTAIYGVPTMFIAQIEHPEFSRYRLDTLRTGVVSGASCPAMVMRRMIEEMHLPEITVGYGMTEISPILYTAPDDALDDRVTTAGTVQPHVECKIVDPATGRIVPRGIIGELCARGYGLMRGYWNDVDATAAAIDRGRWMHTGDLAVMRPDGYMSIVGRLKDVVIRGGENVSPREIEEVLHRHPKVQDAYIVGVPDREYGEEICAWIRLRNTDSASPDEFRQYCRERLAAHKIPRHVYFTSDFPTTPSGKVQKFRLRELAVDRLRGSGATTAMTDM
jgi:fatty-acyl-CoA synthase